MPTVEELLAEIALARREARDLVREMRAEVDVSMREFVTKKIAEAEERLRQEMSTHYKDAADQGVAKAQALHETYQKSLHHLRGVMDRKIRSLPALRPVAAPPPPPKPFSVLPEKDA